jgi:DNA helicase-2/ATP-dependent DNA helicase PcrA
VQGVTLASLHAAKGLEWDTVFLAGCSDGFLPIAMADTAEAIEEERRLMYVGMTRARRELRLSWSGARTAGARASRRPSRFLDGTSSILGEGARAPRPGKGGGRGSRTRGGLKPSTPARCRACGADLATAAQRKTGRCDECPPTYDEATFERLREWRLATARAGSVPAYVVFTDATLTAIAEREPADEAGLAQISGVGARKLGLYGPQVLAVLRGEPIEDVLETASAASESES